MWNGADLWHKLMETFMNSKRIHQSKLMTRPMDILLKDDFMDLMYGNEFLENNPQYMKQRSDKWKRLRQHSHITGSTMHYALGLRTLKSQKLHFDKFVAKSTTNEEPNKAMLHGSKDEVNLNSL